MKNLKYHLYFNDNEKRILIISLNNLRNKLIAEGRYTDCVDELLFKVINAKRKKLKIKYT